MPNTILPVYFAIDTSKSMAKKDSDGNTAYRAAANVCKSIYTAMLGETDLSERLMMEIIFFDIKARTTFVLNSVEEIESWYPQYIDFCPRGEGTRYGAAFEILREEINKGVQIIQQRSEGGSKCYPNRPLVIILTDGEPTDAEMDRDAAFDKLVSADNPYRPNIICIGVGSAKAETLIKYCAGKVCINGHNTEYIIGNENLLLIPDDAELAAKAITEVTEQLVRTIIYSTPTHSLPEPENGIVDAAVVLSSDFPFDLFKNKGELQ